MNKDDYAWQMNEQSENWISKSQLKRNAQSLKDFGEELVQLNRNQLSKIPLNEELSSAILLAQKLKMEGRRRQLQLIGKLLRQQDVQPIKQAFDILKNKHDQQTIYLHQSENWCDKLINDEENATAKFIELYPHAERQKLRTLIRVAKKEQTENRPMKFHRQLYQYLKEVIELL